MRILVYDKLGGRWICVSYCWRMRFEAGGCQMRIAVGCLGGCADSMRIGGCEFFSLVENSKLPAGLVNKVGGEKKHPKEGEVEDEVPKQI